MKSPLAIMALLMASTPPGRTLQPDFCLPARPASPLPYAISRVYFAKRSAKLDQKAKDMLDRQAEVLLTQ